MRPKQSPDRVAVFAEALRLWRSRLRLQAWDVELSTELADSPETYAETDLTAAQYLRATVRAGQRLLRQPAGRYRLEASRTALHELMHVVLEPLVSYAESLTDTDQQRARLAELEDQVCTVVERALVITTSLPSRGG